MGQVTDETLRLMREHADRGEVFSLTANEMLQLAFLAARGMATEGNSTQPELFGADNPPMKVEFPYERTFHALEAAISFAPPNEGIRGYPTLRLSVTNFAQAFNTYTPGHDTTETQARAL